MDTSFQIIKEIAEISDGIITTKQVEDAGLSRTILKPYIEEGLLLKESQGIYSLSESIADEYKLIQMRSEKVIFSYGTALYLLGMSDRVPHNLDVTVPQGYNASRIKKDYSSIYFHYLKKELWELGITSVQSPMGANVRVYDKERCICDLIRDKRNIDTQLYIQAVKEYFKSGCNARKILKYGKIFGVEEKLRTYMEVLS
jgi:predicted transcriptional regulator of viral defense system